MTKGSWCFVLVAVGLGCRQGAGGGAPAGAARKTGAKESKYPARIHAKQTPAAVARPSKPLTLPEAQRYFLKLVNRDREAEGLEPVAWDAVAEKAGREHAADMAEHGFTSHHGTDGSVPELRYTRVGGNGMVQENAACFFDEKERRLDPNPLILPEAIEKTEAAFMGEKPPHDGHRKNILTPWHNRVGIGIVQPVACPYPASRRNSSTTTARTHRSPARHAPATKCTSPGRSCLPRFSPAWAWRASTRRRRRAPPRSTPSTAIPYPSRT